MFSTRTSWGFNPNPLARLLEDKRKSTEDILDLTESNPTRAGLEYPEEEILAGLRNRSALLYAPSPHGLDRARESVAQYYSERGRTVLPEELLLTASTSEAYSHLFKLLTDPGDRVLIPRPSYPLLDYLAKLESVESASYSLFYDGIWTLDRASLEEALSPNTRAVLVVHPGNPTGSYLKRAERGHLVETCRRHNLALIVDEVFFDYPRDDNADRADSFAGEQESLTFVLNGLSKIAGLPQMKLSWIWTGGPNDLKKEANLRLEHISDVFLSVGAPVQQALQDLLVLSKQIQNTINTRIASNYSFVQKAVEGSPIDLLNVEGGWYAILRLPAICSSEQWALELFRDHNVYVHPGYLFDFSMEACLVLSLLTESSIFLQGIRRLLAHVEGRLDS